MLGDACCASKIRVEISLVLGSGDVGRTRLCSLRLVAKWLYACVVEGV